jgi:putative transposase
MGTRNRNSLENYPLRFVTTTCHKWLPLLTSKECKDLVCDSLNFQSEKYAIDILGYVIMRNHFHIVLFSEEVIKLSSFMRDVKKYSAVQICKQLEKEGFDLLLLKYEHGKQKLKTWMDLFDDFCITKPRTFETKLNYIHDNPIRKKYVGAPEEYEYSSASFYLSGVEGPVHVKHYAEVLGIPGYGAI